LPPQWRVPLVYVDKGQRKSTLVRLANLHGTDELLEKMAAALPPPPPAPQPPPDGEKRDESKPQSDDAEGQAGPDEEAPQLPDLKKLIPGRQKPRDGDGADSGTELPPAVAAVFEARRGFANYFPNRVKQQQMLGNLRGQFPKWDAGENPDANASVWKIDGKTEDAEAKPVRIVVGENAHELQIGDRIITATNRNELYKAITSTNVSGILACLDAWRSLLIRGTEGYGECFYRGTVPLLGNRPLRDCLIGSSGELESAWLMHPDSAALEAIEVTADRDDDPAELYVTWGDDRSEPPTHVELRYGNTSVLKIAIDSWTIQAKGEAQ